MSRRNDRYNDSYDRYDEYDDGYGADGYDDRYDDGYGNAGYDDGYGTDGGYQDGYDDDRYDSASGGRYADDDEYGGRYDERYDEPGDDRYDDGYDDGYDSRYDDGYDDGYQMRAGAKSRRGGTARKSARRSGSGKNSRKKIILFIVEAAVLVLVIGILYAVTQVSKVGKVNLQDAKIEQNVSEEAKESAESGAMKGYRNIAFFGVDSTRGELNKNTRSDSIIICSINQETGKVKLVSVYRDTYLNIGNDVYNKCNAAYAQGGPEQAINMLNENLDLNITDFVTIGFGGLTDVINALGGIQINVEEDEISHLNNYQSTMAQELGMKYTEVTQPGLQTLDGLQATAYCRIRYTRGWDYKRAARQRAVIYATVAKAKQANVSQLTEIMNSAFKEIYTSMDVSDMVKDVSNIANYTVETEDSIDTMQNGFPQENLRIQANLGGAKGDCVVPETLSENVKWLHQFLFDDSAYNVSDKVDQYSKAIESDTAGAQAEQMTDADHV